MYTKYIEKEVNIVDTMVDSWEAPKGVTHSILTIVTQSGHKLKTKYFKQEHVAMRGKHELKITMRHFDGEEKQWFVDFGLPKTWEYKYNSDLTRKPWA